MQMYINGAWTDAPAMMAVESPYSGEVIDEVPAASPEQMEQTLQAAVLGAAQMRRLSASERAHILQRAGELLEEQAESLARTISREAGKPIAEARGEAGRIADLLRLCAYEGTQLRGETLPIDAQRGATGKFGMTVRIPCGVVAAITPFNYPLLLVAHKIGPALAAGNAVILKPASQTPLTALQFTRILLEAGLPEHGLQCITGSGAEVGMRLCADARVRKISFTGSTGVGRRITQIAGVKRLSLELGSNCPMVVLADADLEQAAAAAAVGGYVNAGQVCISTQRIIVERAVYAEFVDRLKPKVEAISVGDPLDERTRMGPLISRREAERVAGWVSEAKSGGARVVTGGEGEGSMYAPTIVADVRPQMAIFREELFGPAVAITPADSFAEAVRLTNDSRYGLGAGIFTRDLRLAMSFGEQADCGNVMINWSPLWRADLMPYGGLKESGIGKEGPKYAVEEMTELKTIVMHGLEA